MKKFLLLVVCLFVTGTVMAANLTIEADKQSFNDAENKANFEGNVKVYFDDIVVESPKAAANLDPKTKKLKNANFLEKAYVSQIKNNKKNEVKADIIKLSLFKNMVEAEGNTQTIVTENKKLQPSIIINADTQSYNTETKIMKANGNVIVNYKDATSYSDSGIVKLNQDGDIEQLQLVGNAKILQKDNNFYANKYIYTASTGVATAHGNAYSEMSNKDGSKVIVRSNFQQYNRNENTLVASNNVHVTYKDYKATGPKASVFPDEKSGKLNKIIFSGRSKIEQEGRTIEADVITITVEPKDFTAEGNVRTFIPDVKTFSE